MIMRPSATFAVAASSVKIRPTSPRACRRRRRPSGLCCQNMEGRFQFFLSRMQNRGGDFDAAFALPVKADSCEINDEIQSLVAICKGDLLRAKPWD